jgi:hypothetical protein
VQPLILVKHCREKRNRAAQAARDAELQREQEEEVDRLGSSDGGGDAVDGLDDVRDEL